MISVITPVYNGEQFIESCIKAVIDQQCSDLEHIIIDGGSKDETVNIIKKYAESYAHIRWLSEKDQGQSDAMNKGIAMAKGEILAILNVDDYYEPNVLNHILRIFINLPEPSLLVGNCNVWGEEENLSYVNKPKNLKLSDLLQGPDINPFPFNPSAYFYHTSLHQTIGLYKVNEHYLMDIDFLFKAVQAANVEYMDEVWGNFRNFEGTKTVRASKDRSVKKQMDRLFKSYHKDLPPLLRLKVASRYSVHQNLLRIQYFWKNPKNLFLTVRAKLSTTLAPKS